MYKELSRLIKKKRIERRMTQAQLAFNCGMRNSTIVNIEYGKQRIFLDQALKIRRELKITMKEINDIFIAVEGEK